MARRTFGNHPKEDVKYASSGRAVDEEVQDITAYTRAKNRGTPFDDFKTRKTGKKVASRRSKRSKSKSSKRS